jgi:TonB family protein
MRRLISMNCLIAVFLISSSVAVETHGQTKMCSARILVSVANTNKGVTNVKAVAISKTTGTVYRSIINDDMPLFRSLPEGDYKITLSRSGYKQSSMDRFHDCTSYEEGVYGWSAEMFRGSSRQIVQLGKSKLLYGEAITAVEKGAGTRPMTVVGGVLNGRALTLPEPEYPVAARKAKAAGLVTVEVLVDENGNVVSANAVSGHKQLGASAEAAARNAKFPITSISGNPVKVSGVLTYNFVL